MDTKDPSFDINNVFFPKDVDKEWMYFLTGKNVDIFNAIRQSTNDEVKEGIGLISLGDDVIQTIIDGVYISKDYIIMGIGNISLVGTSITIEALIVETI